jgi:SAM-dependent methyltransferase
MEDATRRYYEQYWREWVPPRKWSQSTFNHWFYHLNLKGKEVVLDVGCGPLDTYAPHIIPKVGKYIAMDCVKPSGQQKMFSLVDFVECNLEGDWHIPDNTVDVVVCIEVLEHLFDPLAVLRRIQKVLRPGGVAVISTPNIGYLWHDRLRMLFHAEVNNSSYDSSNPWRGPHIRFFNVREHFRMAKAAGLKVEHCMGGDSSTCWDVLPSILARTLPLADKTRSWPSFFRLGFLQRVSPSWFAKHVILYEQKPL